MSKVVTLNKILKVLEQEKSVAQRIYIEATNKFEDVARQLYEQLKIKENAELDFSNYIQSKASIKNIKDQANYIENVKERIIYLQALVNKAREKMEEKQEVLTEAHVEVKKIEKVIEIREKERIELEKKLEMESMNEISIRQFMASK